MNKSRRELFGCSEILDLRDVLKIPEYLTDDIYKCRVIYSPNVDKIEFSRYIRKSVRTLQIIEDDKIEYKYKYVNRKCFDDHLKNTTCDDILIIKYGKITDTSFSNIVFWDGSRWITPASPLLKGTKREKLLRENIIGEDEIVKSSLRSFKKAVLINAMLEVEYSPTINIENIIG
jgi:4-amino-4-deoxychorismate lyase